MYNTNALESDNAKSYLLSIQTNDGCLNNNNIRDTSLILYGGWPRTSSSSGGDGDGSSLISCNQISPDYSCARASECQDAGGNILYEYECSNINQFCCSVKASPQTCSEKTGIICNSEQTCSGTSVSASDGSCCLGACQVVTNQETCSLYDGACKSSCDDSEEEVSAGQCSDVGQLCCAEKEVPAGSSKTWIWILLFLILIVIVVIGIMYRDKIRIWLFNRNKVQTKPVQQDRNGGAPPSSMGPRTPPRFGGGFSPQQQRMPVRGNPRDKEMEDTFKKLKEMGS